MRKLLPLLLVLGILGVSNAGMQIAPFGKGPLTDTGGQVFNVKAYGAKGDGVTDDTAAIQSAISTASAAGGGVVLIPIGTFIVKPSTTLWINLASNIEVRGTTGATIKVASNAGDYKTIFGQANAGTLIQNVKITGLLFDQNASGNTGSNITTGTNTTYQNAIYITAGKDIEVYGNRFDPCTGVNTVAVNGSTCEAITVRGNTFRFARGASTIDYDNSAVYIDAKTHSVIDNKFYAAIADHARGCIETHNGQSVVSGNASEGYQTGVNIVTATNVGGSSRPNNDITVSGNTFSRCNAGIHLWPVTGATLRNVTVSNNTISVSQIEHNETTSTGIDVTYISDGSVDGNLENISIVNNTINFVGGDTRIINRKSVGLDPANTWGIGVCPRGNVSNLTISGNTILNAPTKGIAVGQHSGVSGVAQIRRARITGNTIVDAGSNSTLTPSGYRASLFLLADLGDVAIENNTLNDTGTPTANGNKSFYYHPDTAANVSFLPNNKLSGLAATFVTDVDTTKALDTFRYGWAFADSSGGTPANLNVTTAQTICSWTPPLAGVLNAANRNFHFHLAGRTDINNTTAPVFRINLGGVQIASFSTNSITATALAIEWEIDGNFTVVTTGSSGTVICHALLSHRAAAGGGSVTVYSDTVTAASSAINLTTSPALAATVTFAANGATPNVATADQFSGEVTN